MKLETRKKLFYSSTKLMGLECGDLGYQVLNWQFVAHATMSI